MFRILLVLFLIATTNFAKGQLLPDENFILGTLSDYMGRYNDPGKPNRLDSYEPWEKPLVKTVDSLIKINNLDKGVRIESYKDRYGKMRTGSIYSALLSKKYNSYYVFDDHNSGKLKSNVLNTTQAQLQFIAGAYVRYGIPNDTAYCISMGNSLNKIQLCYSFLKKLNCRPRYIIVNNIPTTHTIYFHPSTMLKKRIEKYMPLRKMLQSSFNDWFRESYDRYKAGKKN